MENNIIKLVKFLILNQNTVIFQSWRGEVQIENTNCIYIFTYPHFVASLYQGSEVCSLAPDKTKNKGFSQEPVTHYFDQILSALTGCSHTTGLSIRDVTHSTCHIISTKSCQLWYLTGAVIHRAINKGCNTYSTTSYSLVSLSWFSLVAMGEITCYW